LCRINRGTFLHFTGDYYREALSPTLWLTFTERVALTHRIAGSERPKYSIFDHVYYVISGRIRATIGDTERIVGADSMIYCPSNIKHSITNIGKRPAKILRIKGSIEGEKSGDAVFTSGEVRIDYWFPPK